MAWSRVGKDVEALRDAEAPYRLPAVGDRGLEEARRRRGRRRRGRRRGGGRRRGRRRVVGVSCFSFAFHRPDAAPDGFDRRLREVAGNARRGRGPPRVQPQFPTCSRAKSSRCSSASSVGLCPHGGSEVDIDPHLSLGGEVGERAPGVGRRLQRRRVVKGRGAPRAVPSVKGPRREMVGGDAGTGTVPSPPRERERSGPGTGGTNGTQKGVEAPAADRGQGRCPGRQGGARRGGRVRKGTPRGSVAAVAASRSGIDADAVQRRDLFEQGEQRREAPLGEFVFVFDRRRSRSCSRGRRRRRNVDEEPPAGGREGRVDVGNDEH